MHKTLTRCLVSVPVIVLVVPVIVLIAAACDDQGCPPGTHGRDCVAFAVPDGSPFRNAAPFVPAMPGSARGDSPTDGVDHPNVIGLHRHAGPSAFLYSSECGQAEFRAVHGSLAHGELRVRTRIAVARNDKGYRAADDETIAADLAAVNKLYAAAKMRFVAEPTHVLDKNDAFFWSDYDEDTVWSALGWGSLAWMRKDSLPIVYSYRIAAGGSTFAGFGGNYGVSLAAEDGVHPSTSAQEIGHYFSLEHTHACVDGDGDGIPDTAHDPGAYWLKSMASSEGCKSEKFGLCWLKDGSCAAQCSDGSTPDTGNYMSYWPSACQNHFSTEQVLFMRCVVRTAMKHVRLVDEETPKCEHECPSVGEARCRDGGVVRCEQGPKCKLWGKVEACGQAQTCQTGKCIEQKTEPPAPPADPPPQKCTDDDDKCVGDTLQWCIDGELVKYTCNDALCQENGYSSYSSCGMAWGSWYCLCD